MSSRLPRLPDELNADVQDLVTQEIESRVKSNAGFWVWLFGRQPIDRESVLAELKAARVMEDDRYFLAAMGQRRVKEVV